MNRVHLTLEKAPGLSGEQNPDDQPPFSKTTWAGCRVAGPIRAFALTFISQKGKDAATGTRSGTSRNKEFHGFSGNRFPPYTHLKNDRLPRNADPRTRTRLP